MFKAINKIVFSRLFMFGVLVGLQILGLIYVLQYFGNYFPYINIAIRILAVAIVFIIIGSDMEDGFKISWIVFVLAVPIVGVGFVIFTANSKILSRTIRKISRVKKRTDKLYYQKMDYSDQLFNSEIAKKEACYLDNANFKTYQGSATEFYPSGEEFKVELIKELKNAQNFIFIEYFIIKNGVFWKDVLNVLKKKVAQGVEVRVIYDDFGCGLTLKSRYFAALEKIGIKTVVFNRLSPLFSTRLQNRDHRKICVVDGNVGFTGGINIGDEYINIQKRFGHWKDTGVKIVGQAVWTLTYLFLQSWNSYRQNEEDDFDIYRPSPSLMLPIESTGYVSPYGSSPFDSEPIGRNVYLNLINQAQKYIYATTPYLILDGETRSALIMAARNGIEVKIITPGIFDKKIVSMLTRDNYRPLLNAGIKIYEYTPGFIHAKEMIVDDICASIGTVNLDYRSFYHHFECGTFIGHCSTVLDMKKDFLSTLKDSKEITIDDLKNRTFSNRLITLFLHLIAPLM